MSRIVTADNLSKRSEIVTDAILRIKAELKAQKEVLLSQTEYEILKEAAIQIEDVRALDNCFVTGEITADFYQSHQKKFRFRAARIKAADIDPDASQYQLEFNNKMVSFIVPPSAERREITGDSLLGHYAISVNKNILDLSFLNVLKAADADAVVSRKAFFVKFFKMAKPVAAMALPSSKQTAPFKAVVVRQKNFFIRVRTPDKKVFEDTLDPKAFLKEFESEYQKQKPWYARWASTVGAFLSKYIPFVKYKGDALDQLAQIPESADKMTYLLEHAEKSSSSNTAHVMKTLIPKYEAMVLQKAEEKVKSEAKARADFINVEQADRDQLDCDRFRELSNFKDFFDSGLEKAKADELKRQEKQNVERRSLLEGISNAGELIKQYGDEVPIWVIKSFGKMKLIEIDFGVTKSMPSPSLSGRSSTSSNDLAAVHSKPVSPISFQGRQQRSNSQDSNSVSALISYSASSSGGSFSFSKESTPRRSTSVDSMASQHKINRQELLMSLEGVFSPLWNSLSREVLSTRCCNGGIYTLNFKTDLNEAVRSSKLVGYFTCESAIQEMVKTYENAKMLYDMLVACRKTIIKSEITDDQVVGILGKLETFVKSNPPVDENLAIAIHNELPVVRADWKAKMEKRHDALTPVATY